MLVDLDDTGRCPTAATCAGCGTGQGELTVVTAGSGAGVLCVSLCPDCLTDDLAVPGPAAARGVAEHCGHLDIALSDMDAVLESGWSW
ncbi:hypothetical protein Ae717Ps2_0373 [Pseudonocardia sp. Ae717_Ps2]|uniref:hypothetical protein n=2 Tax=unclassified Pseudonocardia TaxID=2619320 RepID=UPI00094AC5E9|nr:hypothetical protein [Pseudonocardia sp. Ae717_Ps2]OLM12111.1 hypothetical protein Ae505Ps2_2238 [Pseudonocardia sp. Ae505_Ps2]OLM29480.1 hypothetical protein Ae717Ps2_0373 [Pseudonocardia sp. Ae717_Ps2]